MLIGGIQKLSLSDYPGKTCAVIFTIGCNLRCRYCHNAELVLPECYAEEMSIDEVHSFLESKQNKLEGIVVSGGEPTLHKDLPDFLRYLKSLGFLVKLDSNGTRPEVLEKLIEDKLVDFIAMDIKGPVDKYPVISCREIGEDIIKRSIGLIIKSGLPHEFRTTIVRSQLSIKDFEIIGEMIKGADRYALQKFISGKTLDPAMSDEETYDDKDVEEIKKVTQKYVKECVVH